MDPSRLLKLRDLFELARDKPPTDWAGILAAVDGADDALRQEALDLLREHRRRAVGEEADVALDPDLASERLAGLERRFGEPRPTRPRYEPHGGAPEGTPGTLVRTITDTPLRRELRLEVSAGDRVGVHRDVGAHARLLRRASILAQLDHPAIIPVHDAGLDPCGPAWMTTKQQEIMPLVELMDGDSDRAAWRLDRRVRALVAIGEALAHAHARGVAHGSLTHDAIRIGSFGEVYLVGWENARLRSETGPASLSADLAALGVLLAWLRRGTPGRSRELDAIESKARSAGTGEGYPDVATFTDDLRAYLERRVVLAYASGPAAELWKWLQRHRASATVALAGVMIVSAAVAFSYTRVRSEREVAVAARDEVLRLADLHRARSLAAEAGELWPATPDKAAALAAWLTRLDELQQRARDHERTLAALEHQPSDDDPGRPAFSSDQDRLWWMDTLRDLLALVERLCASDPYDPRSRASIEARLEFARTVEERSLTHHSETWTLAIAAIGDPARSPRYGGLALEPQLGLVPVGPDPDSGLWEFWQLGTGARPNRVGGRTVVRAETAIVFVLVPSGSFWMGSQRDDPDARNYVPASADFEGPVHEVTVGPFFLSKYEMTQGQWHHLTGERPSRFARILPESDLDSHPVDNVTWLETRATLARHGMTLPTEGQWEYACRAGTSTAFSHGDDPAELFLYANLRDATAEEFLGESSGSVTAALDDGHALTSPVGSYRSNPFGLHDMIGNVLELCADGLVAYDDRARTADSPRVEPEPEGHVIRRGGCYLSVESAAGSATRTSTLVHARAGHTGVRPARLLQR